jgi:hypothetical protein
MRGNMHWTEVVPPLTMTDAPPAFDAWIRRNGLVRTDLVDHEIRVDVIRTTDGDRMRYMVSSAALERLGVELE